MFHTIYTIAKNTFKECLREPIYLLVLISVLCMIGLFPVFSMFVFREQEKLVMDSALATIMLFTFLNKWNDWMTSMLYINDQKLISLQYLLQRIMLNVQLLQQNQQAGTAELINATELPTETVRMAMAVVVAGPALLVFPFFQKYFTKGLTVGSVKG